MNTYTLFRLVPKSMTFNDLWARFKVIDSINAAKWRRRTYSAQCTYLLTYTVGSGRIKPAIYPKRLKIGLERNLLLTAYIQESCAIAKMTAQCALYMGALKIFGTPCQSPIISNIFHGLLFGSTLWMFIYNVKSVALSVPEIIGGTKKFGQFLDTPTLPFLKKILWAFIRIGHVNMSAKFEVRSFTHSWDNRGYSNWAVPGYAHAPFSPKFWMGFYLDWPYKCTRQIWSP